VFGLSMAMTAVARVLNVSDDALDLQFRSLEGWG
jgi:hypothetical protein